MPAQETLVALPLLLPQVVVLNPPVTDASRRCTSFLQRLHTCKQCMLLQSLNRKGLPSVQLLRPTDHTLLRSSTPRATLAAVIEGPAIGPSLCAIQHDSLTHAALWCSVTGCSCITAGQRLSPASIGFESRTVPTLRCMSYAKLNVYQYSKGFCNAGIAAWTCHQPSSVFDLVPADLVSSAILTAAAHTIQVSLS